MATYRMGRNIMDGYAVKGRPLQKCYFNTYMIVSSIQWNKTQHIPMED